MTSRECRNSSRSCEIRSPAVDMRGVNLSWAGGCGGTGNVPRALGRTRRAAQYRGLTEEAERPTHCIAGRTRDSSAPTRHGRRPPVASSSSFGSPRSSSSPHSGGSSLSSDPGPAAGFRGKRPDTRATAATDRTSGLTAPPLRRTPEVGSPYEGVPRAIFGCAPGRMDLPARDLLYSLGDPLRACRMDLRPRSAHPLPPASPPTSSRVGGSPIGRRHGAPRARTVTHP
jgi:hypothetical protein